VAEGGRRRAEGLNSGTGELKFRPSIYYLQPSTICRLPFSNELMNCESATNSIKKSRWIAGFTLIEILLAFLILGVVLTTVLASFNAVFSTTEALNDSSRYFDMAKSCLNRMTLDLQAIYVRQPPLYKKPEFDDPPDLFRIVGSTAEVGGTSFATIRFASSAHVRLEKSRRDGIAEIVYYVHAKEDGGMVLKRA